jgi:site-specific recombinase XerD
MSETNTVSPLRQRMIEDMAARKLNPHTQRSHIYSCKRFTAWLKRSPDTATADEVRRFQLHLIESGASICNRNRIVTGVRFLFRVTLRRHDLAAEIWHLKEPQKLPPVLSPEEVKRVLTMATSLKARAMLTLAYGCGLRASEVVRLRACDIDSEQMIIRVVQAKGRKDRNVMLPAEILELLRQWWKSRPTKRDAGVAPEQRWLFPGRIDHHPTTAANRGHVSLDQLKVMSAIERCRTAALGGHVARCENAACGHTLIGYNSCRNRHCPKCQAAASRRWLADREAELLPVPYFHVVYTLPSKLRDIAYQNKRVLYDLLMRAAAETTLAIAANPRRLGARIGITAVLHTWGSTLSHHPHVHMIVPGGGISLDGSRWVACRSNFLVHVNLLARLFSGKMLAMLADAHDAGQLTFFNAHARLADKTTFKRFIAPLRRIKWVVYCKAPFAGPKQVLRYLSRYTHRVAISNRRLIAADDAGVAFRWKDYRIDGPGRWKTMRLHPHEFVRRFLLHVLPRGFHRIRHYGLFANANRADNIATARALLGADPPAANQQQQPDVKPDAPRVPSSPCPRCGARMIVIEVFARGCEPRRRPTPSRFDTS